MVVMAPSPVNPPRLKGLKKIMRHIPFPNPDPDPEPREDPKK